MAKKRLCPICGAKQQNDARHKKARFGCGTVQYPGPRLVVSVTCAGRSERQLAGNPPKGPRPSRRKPPA